MKDYIVGRLTNASFAQCFAIFGNIVQKIALLSKKCDVFLVMFEVSEWALTVLKVLELKKQT